MNNRYMEGDAAAEILERRWFAAYKTAEAMRADCETLRKDMELAQVRLRRASGRLAELEAMRDALGEEYAAMHERDCAEKPDASRRVMSAA
jgi:hypothetical protein